jgi:DNA-binding SARP family transcriptional activator
MKQSRRATAGPVGLGRLDSAGPPRGAYSAARKPDWSAGATTKRSTNASVLAVCPGGSVPWRVWARDEFSRVGAGRSLDGRASARAGRGPQQVKLLAFLLLNANRAVSADAVTDAVWGSQGGGTAKRLQMRVLRLRRALAPLDGEDKPRVRTVGHGYMLSVRSGDLDAEAFSERVRDGHRGLGDGDPGRASDLLAEALELWRGPPFADVAFEDFAQGEIRRLEELRLITLETRIDADLQLGGHSKLIPELEELLAQWPTRERLAGQLMTALYQSGRQGDALEIYQRARTRLAEDLGLEPGPALKTLQTQSSCT